MPFRVEIALKSGYRDAIGEGVRNAVKNSLSIGVDDVRTIKVYTVNATLTDEEKKAIAEGPFSDAVVQKYAIDEPLASGFDWLVEVGFRPGVTDNEGKTGREAIEDRLGRRLASHDSVHTSMQYLINGNLTRAQIETVSKQLLGNELIERFEIVDGRSWDARKGIEAKVPLVRDQHKPRVAEVNLDVSDEELMAISRKGTLALTLDEMKLIRDYFKRPKVLAERKKIGLGQNPTDVELETACPDLERALQAQDLQRRHRLHRRRQTFGGPQPFQDLHPRLYGRDHEEGGLAVVRIQRQRRCHQVRQRLQHRHQSRNAQQPVRAGPLRRRHHGHRRR